MSSPARMMDEGGTRRRMRSREVIPVERAKAREQVYRRASWVSTDGHTQILVRIESFAVL